MLEESSLWSVARDTEGAKRQVDEDFAAFALAWFSSSDLQEQTLLRAFLQDSLARRFVGNVTVVRRKREVYFGYDRDRALGPGRQLPGFLPDDQGCRPGHP